MDIPERLRIETNSTPPYLPVWKRKGRRESSRVTEN
jgi:hypothetical protein